MTAPLRPILLFAAFGLLSACADIQSVPAWERGYLAEDGMHWENQPREAKFESHVYTSKEASSGGAGAAGGGCGCN